MLPPVIFQNQFFVALLLETVVNFRGNVWKGIEIVLDWPVLADERLKFGFPALHQDADFGKITLWYCLYEGYVHSVME